MPSIAFQVTLLLLIAVGGYLIASWFHQSTVVGEILLGLIFGPSILGLITYTDFVSGLAEMGAIIMLFVYWFLISISKICSTVIIFLLGYVV